MKKMKFYFLWLSLIMIIVFLIQNLIPGFTEKLILNSNSYKEPYRFLTAIFLHQNPLHLLYNLFALLLFGLILERLIGSNKFLIIFFSSGIIANLISVNFYKSSLGASGSIMGIIGAITILRPFMMVWAFGIILPMFIATIIWIIGDILGIFIPDNIGHYAHLSGIVVGALIGLYIRLKIKKIKIKKQNIEIPEKYLEDWEDYYIK